MKFTLSALAAIVATIILWAHHDPMILAHGDHPDGDPAASIDNPLPAANAKARPESMEDRKDPPNISAELLHRYNSGANMRAFMGYALQHPEQGGFFYAVKVMRQCQELAMGPRPGESGASAYRQGEDSSRILKTHNAWKQLHMRCADFIPEEISNTRARDLWSSGISLDPLIKAVTQYHASFDDYLSKPTQTPRLNTAVAEILKLEDPLVLEDLGFRLAVQTTEFHAFGNTDISSALYLLPCGTGLQCDQHEFDISLRCAATGECDSSRFQRVERMLEASPGAYGRVLSAYEAMRTAVALGDAQFFERR